MIRVESSVSTEPEWLYTWEEISWVTAMSIDQLSELYRRNALFFGETLDSSAVPPGVRPEALNFLVNLAAQDTPVVR